MKKLFLIFFFYSFSPYTTAGLMVRTSPVALVLGAFNSELIYSHQSNFAYGLGFISWQSETQDVEFELFETHARVDYYFLGAFKQGWFLNAQFGLIDISLKTNDSFGEEYSGSASGNSITLGAAYHWQWEKLFIDLGMNIASYSINQTIELTSDDGDTVQESIPSGASSGIVLDLGYVF